MGEALSWANSQLREISESPRTDAHRLLSHVTDREPSWFMANDAQALSSHDLRRYSALVWERRSGVPIAYIIGSSGFFGATYAVDPNVLVPRPETEHLVEAAIEFLRRVVREQCEATVLDVGTGSGALACAIARAVPEAIVHATDISADAIAVAKRNARQLGVEAQCTFFTGDLTVALPRKRYACIIANLPYIPTAQLPRRPQSAGFEPVSALDGGADGLDLYRRLLPQLSAMLIPRALVLFEGAPPVMKTLARLCCEHFPTANVTAHRDYARLERFISVRTGRVAHRTE